MLAGGLEHKQWPSETGFISEPPVPGTHFPDALNK